MEFVEVLTILLPITAMFAWNRSESNADRRDMNQKIDANMRETRELIKGIGEKIEAQVNAIQLEIKDFHGRLCAIESRKHE